MEIKVKGLVDQEVEAIIDIDEIIKNINDTAMPFRWPVVEKILDNIRISELTDNQRARIKKYLKTELAKLEEHEAFYNLSDNKPVRKHHT